jgi:hypothetical protein
LLRTEHLSVSQRLTDKNILSQADRLPEDEPADPVDRIAKWAGQELDSLLLKRAAIAKRIITIRDTLAGLVDVFGSHVKTEELPASLSKPPLRHTLRTPGLTELCRQILMESPQPLSTAEIFHRIHRTNPELLARQKHPKIALAVVLRRLVTYEEVCDGIDEQNLRTWLWIGVNNTSESNR